MVTESPENQVYIDDPTVDSTLNGGDVVEETTPEPILLDEDGSIPQTYKGKTISSVIEVKPRLRAGRDRSKWHLITMKEIKEMCNKLTKEWKDSGKKDWIALRDACMLAILICFGKRSSEIVNLKVKDIDIGDEFLKITFTVLKKEKEPKKKCPTCGKLKRFKAIVCDEDGTSLKNAELIKLNDLSGPVIRVKAIKRSDQMSEFIHRWVYESIVKSKTKECWLFPPADSSQGGAQPSWEKHLYRGSIKNILHHRGITNFWAHLFRASAATALANQLMKEGVDPMPYLLERFDWVREDTAKIYIEMGRETRDENLVSNLMSRLE